MNTPEWLKPGIFAAGIGAAAIAVVGFSWGGWMTGGEAKMLASNQSRMAVVSAMVPICLEQSKMDPQVAVTLAKLKDTSSYQRNDVLMQAGWATMPGSEQPDRMVANACVEALSANF